MSTSIPCPNCQTTIRVEMEGFLRGETYACPSCEVKLGMDQPTDVSIDKLQELKDFAKKKKEPTTAMPCPDCTSSITFNTKDLISGKPITCAHCKAQISLGD